MPICGLSNQWKTREGLLEQFANDAESKMRQLLKLLDSRPGPTIYVGTSHSQMNFSNRDVIRDDDRTQPFAYVDVMQSSSHSDDFFYRVETRRVEKARPTVEWFRQDFTDVETVVELLIEAYAYAGIPPKKSSMQQLQKRIAILPLFSRVAVAAIVIERTLEIAWPFIDADTRGLVRKTLNVLWSSVANESSCLVELEKLHDLLDTQGDAARGANWEEGEPPLRPIPYALCCSCTLPIASLRWKEKEDSVGGVLFHYFDIWSFLSECEPGTYNSERHIDDEMWAENLVRWIERQTPARWDSEHREPD